MLAVHIPNPLPKSALGFHFTWMHPAGRLIWASVILVQLWRIRAQARSAAPSNFRP